MHSEWFDQASAARLSGNEPQAIALCKQRLSTNPDDADAQSLLGVCLAETGDIANARPLIEQSLSANPDHWRYLLNLSVLHEAEGNLVAAKDAAKYAAENGPDRFECWGRLGDLYGRLDDYNGAADALKKALAINPDIPPLILRLAGACFEIEDYQGANTALDQFEKFAPGHPHSLKLRTHIARQTSDWDGLIASASAWLAVASPDEAEPARVALAFAYAQAGLFARAAEAYQPLTTTTPQQPQHLATYAQYLLGARDLEAAKAFYERAIEIDPRHADSLAGLSRIHVYLGKFDAAAEYARRAIEIDPENVEAFAQLALSSSGRLSDDEISKLSQLGEDENLQLDHRARCWFSVGDAHHRNKNADKAFAAWSRANVLKLEIAAKDRDASYDRATHEETVRNCVQWFTATPPTDKYRTENRPTPIFIVGMPRSGTTLLENAISAHSQVSSGGELPVVPYARLAGFRLDQRDRMARWLIARPCHCRCTREVFYSIWRLRHYARAVRD